MGYELILFLLLISLFLPRCNKTCNVSHLLRKTQLSYYLKSLFFLSPFLIWKNLKFARHFVHYKSTLPSASGVQNGRNEENEEWERLGWKPLARIKENVLSSKDSKTCHSYLMRKYNIFFCHGFVRGGADDCKMSKNLQTHWYLQYQLKL